MSNLGMVFLMAFAFFGMEILADIIDLEYTEETENIQRNLDTPGYIDSPFLRHIRNMSQVEVVANNVVLNNITENSNNIENNNVNVIENNTVDINNAD